MLAARATFSKPTDEPGAAYYQARALSVQETGRRIVDELIRVAALMAADALADGDLDVEDLRLVHRAVFEPVFGDLAVDFRQVGHDVTYPVWERTPFGETIQRSYRGSAPRQIERRLKRAMDRLTNDLSELAAIGERGVTLQQAVRPAARVYAEVIAVHPWADGNGRTAWLVLTHTLIRSGLLAVATQPTIDSRVALGAAITRRQRREIGPLAERLAATIKRSSAAADNESK
jgi:fido (protein-threonine AMPylation protein)